MRYSIMRKSVNRVLAFTMCMALAASAFVAPKAEAAVKAKKVTLSASKKTLTVGEKFTLKVKKVKPAKAKKTVTWKTSNKKVASVSKKGVVVAVKAGSAKITATSKSNKKAKATCTVTVKAKGSDPIVTSSPKPSVVPSATASAKPTTSPTLRPSPSPTPIPSPTPTPITIPSTCPYVDYDAETMTASNNYGTPVIDGEIDTVWNKVTEWMQPNKTQTGFGDGSTEEVWDYAKFKVLWDENHIYILAKVHDTSLDATAGESYYQDSIEVFLSETNSGTDKEEDVDSNYLDTDYHFRVNYENEQTADMGPIEILKSSTKVLKNDPDVGDGYLVEISIQTTKTLANGDSVGFELQQNCCSDGIRNYQWNFFDTGNTAWQYTSSFGTLILGGKP